MLITSACGHLYPKMLAVLKLLPVPLTFVSVDIPEGTEDYDLIKYMQYYKHLEVIETNNTITEIASTKQGVNFYEKFSALYRDAGYDGSWL